MKLKRRVKNLNEVEEKYRGLYEKQTDGTFLLDAAVKAVDDVPADDDKDDDDKDDASAAGKKKLAEFRNNNIALKKELDALKKKLATVGDLDEEQLAELRNKAQTLDELAEKDLLKKGKIDDVITQRVNAALKEPTDQLKKITTRNKELEEAAGTASKKYKSLRVQTEVTRAAQRAGTLRPGALDDIIRRAESVWDIDDEDQLVGKNVFNSRGDAATLDEWATSLVKEAPYFFEAGQGGGAPGGVKKPSGQSGTKTLNNPSALDIGHNLEALAKGQMTVVRSEG